MGFLFTTEGIIRNPAIEDILPPLNDHHIAGYFGVSSATAVEVKLDRTPRRDYINADDISVLNTRQNMEWANSFRDGDLDTDVGDFHWVVDTKIDNFGQFSQYHQ